MFGMKNRVLTKQLRRAVEIENLLMAALFDYQIADLPDVSGDREPTETELALTAGTVHYIIGRSITAQLATLKGSAHDERSINNRASDMFQADPELERLVIRLLYEIASLANMLENDSWAKDFVSKHPRIMQILTEARTKHPNLFSDPQETEFRKLLSVFLDKYDPDHALVVSKLFA